MKIKNADVTKVAKEEEILANVSGGSTTIEYALIGALLGGGIFTLPPGVKFP